MDLLSGRPYWLLKHGLINTYPSVDRNIKTDVAIIGAGITGALMAHHLGKAGYEVVVVDRRHVGLGSTAGNTSLLQYEIDVPLHKLMEKVGERKAVRSYQLCLEAIPKILAIAKPFKSVEASLRPSLQYASFKNHVDDLRLEFAARKKHKISSVHWLDTKSIKQKFQFSAPAGLLSENAATLDAYHLTHAVLGACTKNGTMVYDNSEVKRILYHKKSVELHVQGEFKIRARYLVICCGYESQKYLPKPVEEIHATYAIVSEPFAAKKMWFRNALIWETSDPYLYMRVTDENRIIVGGKDDAFYSPEKRDANLPRKKIQLEKAFNKMFPHLAFKTDFSWGGAFCTTKDGLPFIGQIRKQPNVFFTLGFGGNGIVYSQIGAEIISNLLRNGHSPDAELFHFDR